MSSSRETVHDQFFGREHVTVIEPPRRFALVSLREFWAYRELLVTLAMRTVRVRYKQTVLGVAWALLQPLMQMVIFSVIFGRVAKLPSQGFPYPVFVYSGLVAWNYFAASTTSAVGSLVGNAHLISKVYFPRLIIPCSSVVGGLVDFAVSAVLLIALMIYYRVGITANLLVAPLLVFGLAFTAAGVGMALGALNVMYRDLQYATPFMVQIWLYLTPVVYPAESLPDSLRWIVAINPMTGMVDAFRSVFLGKPFDVPAILISLAVSLLIFIVGAAYFQRVERRMADVV